MSEESKKAEAGEVRREIVLVETLVLRAEFSINSPRSARLSTSNKMLRGGNPKAPAPRKISLVIQRGALELIVASMT